MGAAFRVVAITGASSGLGALLAAAYAGPQVVLGLIGRNRDRLASVAAACAASGAVVCSETIDVADGPAMAEWLTPFDREDPVELVVAHSGLSDRIGGHGADEPGVAA